MNTETWTIEEICAVLTLIVAVLSYIQQIRKKKKGAKKAPHWYNGIFLPLAILLFSGVLIWQLVSNNNSKPTQKEPLLVFAGGGSVRNYLQDTTKYGIDVRTYPHSINIAIASGSAWRVLAEEYQFRHMKDSDNLNMFTTICLSAGKMSKEFCSEYLSDMTDAIVAEVYLGDDRLVAYISNVLRDYWSLPIFLSEKKEDVVFSKVLAQKLYDLNESNQKDKVSIFTTNKTSGTLEAYKECFKNYINLEAMIENKQVYIYYDNMSAHKVTDKLEDGGYIMLGSEYYFVKGLDNTRVYLSNSNEKPIEYICKPMYLYFLAHKYNDESNEFIIEKSVLEFLKHEKMKVLPKSDPYKWENDILGKGIIEYDLPDNPLNRQPVRIN